MAKFNYKARTKEGKMETGTIEASNKDAAAVLLQKYGMFVTGLEETIERKQISDFLKFEGGVSKKDLAIFSRQLAVMMQSRVPVIQSLESLAVQSRKANFRKIILEVANLVEEGVALSDAFARYPRVFDNFYVSLVRSGEISGKIADTLYYISDHLEREHDIIAQVRQAMIYPAFTLGILFVVINIVVIFLLPRIEELIKQSSTAPDAFTVFTLNFYDFLGSWWWLLVLGIFALAGGIFFYFRTKEGKKVYDRLSLRIPYLGDILRKVFLARFCGNIATLMAAGISINKALKITEDTISNSVYKNIIGVVEKRVSEGEKISSALVQYPLYFPSFTVQMIKVGEDTGKLDKTLLEVVNFYQKEVKAAIDLFLTLLEPMLIIFLGLIVGLLAISVFAPLYNALGNI
jgi:type IV pilus assembly protein PilC